MHKPLKIKHLRVFAVTATWSVLAYVWLYVIVVANTTDLVEPWEALLTLLFFPLLTLWAWIADKRLLVYDMMNKTYEYDAHKNLIRESEKSSKKRNQVKALFFIIIYHTYFCIAYPHNSCTSKTTQNSSSGHVAENATFVIR